MQIQQLQGWPEPRQRTSNMIGQALGGAIEGAGNLYLQGKMQNYFQGLKDQRDIAVEQSQRKQSAQAYGSLLKNPMITQYLMGIPSAQHLNFMKEFGGGGVSDLITGAAGPIGRNISPIAGAQASNMGMTQPANVQGQEEAPTLTPPSTAANVAQAQRMGLTDEGAPAEEVADQQQVTPEQQMFQPQAEQPTMPGGAIAPKPEKYPLGSKSSQELRDILNNIPGATQRKEVYNAYLKQQDMMMKEKEQERKQRKETREVEKEPRKYLKDLNDQYNATFKTKNIYKTLIAKAPELQEGHILRKYLGTKFKLPAGWTQDTKGEYLDKMSEQLMRGVSGTYKGKILQSEIENFAKSNPSLLNSKEGIVLISKISLEMDKLIERQWEEANAIRNKANSDHTPLPEDLQSMVMEKTARISDDIYDNIAKIIGIPIGTPGSSYMMTPDGTIGEVPKANIDEALKMGWVLQ